MPQVRNPAVAGSFYPSNASELQTMIDDLLVEAGRNNPVVRAPKAIVVPHAGYIYSGPVAASAYAALGDARERVRRVVLLGPAHRVLLRGLALPESGAFATPLGCVPVDQGAVDVLSQLQQVSVSAEAHAMEHSLEVHLPFLQSVLADFQLVPLVVGDASAGQVAELLERMWGAEETLIVVSSDLSHYHDYETARRLDRATSDAIESFAYEDLDFDQACGRIPLTGLLLVARARGMTERTVDLRNSGDTAGPRDQVVGYGAYLFYE